MPFADSTARAAGELVARRGGGWPAVCCGGRVVYFQHVSDVAHMQHDAVDSLWDPASTSTNNDQQQVVLRLKISIYDLRESRNATRDADWKITSFSCCCLVACVCLCGWVPLPAPGLVHRFFIASSPRCLDEIEFARYKCTLWSNGVNVENYQPEQKTLVSSTAQGISSTCASISSTAQGYFVENISWRLHQSRRH